MICRTSFSRFRVIREKRRKPSMIDADHILQLYLSGASREIVAVRETIQHVLAWPTTSRPPHLVIKGESRTGETSV
jgi:hypothetical protein